MREPHPASGQFKVIIAENQAEYDKLPALIDRESGIVITEWQLTPEEVIALVDGGRIRLFTITKGAPFHPIAFQVVEAEDILTLENTH
jgi:hypothetical protein